MQGNIKCKRGWKRQLSFFVPEVTGEWIRKAKFLKI
jgi:hypothetical protein